MVQGTCLCSGIAWEVSGDFTRMSHCHCSRCRKAHGAAFATFIAASADGFRWLRGRELIQRGEPTPGGVRPFCSRCGSVVATEPANARVFIPAGCLDDDPGIRPERHIFVASKPRGTRSATTFRSSTSIHPASALGWSPRHQRRANVQGRCAEAVTVAASPTSSRASSP